VTEPGGVRVWIGTVATAALFVAGCGIGGRLILGAPAIGEPLSAADYARVLTEVDAAIRPPFTRLGTGGAAHRAAAQSLRAGADRLDETAPPKPVQATQDELSGALRVLADVVEMAGGGSPPCPAASPVTAVLQSTEAERVRARAEKLRTADAAYAFGTFLPAAPAQRNRRLKTGAFVRTGSRNGIGEFHVTSGKGTGDTAISLVRDRRPVVTVYVRDGAEYRVDGVEAGTYRVFVASGADWDAKRKGFTRDCSFTRFDDDFEFESSGTRWEIELSARAGNATTTGVDPADFPTG
jgi:hypothetical protein